MINDSSIGGSASIWLHEMTKRMLSGRTTRVNVGTQWCVACSRQECCIPFAEFLLPAYYSPIVNVDVDILLAALDLQSRVKGKRVQLYCTCDSYRLVHP